MGNENKIKKSMDETKAQFLPQIFEDPDGVIDVYSLDDEFAKTTKNKGYVFKGIVAFFLISVLVTGLIITAVIQKKGKDSVVDIKNFSDVEVQELMSESKKYQLQVETLSSEIESLRMELRDKLNRLQSDYLQGRENIEQEPLTDEEKQDALKKLENDFSRDVALVKSEYGGKISQRENEADNLQKKIDENKSKLGNDKEKEMILSSEDILQSIEIQRLKDYYEGRIDILEEKHRREIADIERKYNPVFRESNLNSVLNTKASRVELPEQFLSGVENDLASDKIYSASEIEKMRRNIALQVALNDRMQKIPYKNSMPKSLTHSESISKRIFTDYDKIVIKLIEILRKQKIQLTNYNYAFSSKLQSEKENGYILDSRNVSRIGLFISPIYEIKTGDIALVFRSDDEYIASIRFKYISGMLFAELIETADGKTIEPFDKILLNVVKAEK
ncbi:MAG: hypothetical protein JW982_04030 [Spirochaetes bacterium]|nr:hypothetical protein [Spirochaetota bacterium]